MVPKSASVLVCLWENTPIQDGDLRLEIQKCCEGFGSDPRGVKFHLGKRAGPFEKFLSDSDSTVPTDPADTTRSDSATAVDTCESPPLTFPETQSTPRANQAQDVAIYTVKPMNVVRIYHRDAESTVTMVREEFLNDGLCPRCSDTNLGERSGRANTPGARRLQRSISPSRKPTWSKVLSAGSPILSARHLT